ncbi:hypothetical protein D6833_13305 [Candidatus Parcubacteria bacterium]|nr:MAG: hypothetical protein D6833_13305 [Candidatus Parcubacteria bacterium]
MKSKLLKALSILGGLAAILGAVVVVMDLAKGHGPLSPGWVVVLVGVFAVLFSFALQRSGE